MVSENDMLENVYDYESYLILGASKRLSLNEDKIKESTFSLMCLQEAKERIEKILTGASNDSVNS